MPYQLILLLMLVFSGQQINAAAPRDLTLLQNHCADCHNGSDGEGGFSLSELQGELSQAHVMKRWVRVYDRIASGEMPPRDVEPIERETRQKFLADLSAHLTKTQMQQYAEQGRVQGKRLTNIQLEKSLQHLLGIDIPIAVDFPEETKTSGYTTVADGQPMSHFQMEQHLQAVDKALTEAFRRGLSREQPLLVKNFDAAGLSRTNPKRRCREPEIIDNHGVVWSSGLVFYGRIPATTAREDGWYRFTIRAKGLKLPETGGVWCTVRKGRCVSSAPLLGWVGAIEATADTQEWTFETWLPAGEMIEIRPGDETLKRARFAGGQVGTGEGGPQNVPGVAIESIQMEQIHKGPDDVGLSKILFSGFQIDRNKDWNKSKLSSPQPVHDLKQAVIEFARRAFRRPLAEEDVEPYADFAVSAYEKNQSLTEGLWAGYRAVLCSPQFLYFQELPGRLDDYAIASRLSYFLWNAPPDGDLLELASAGKLTQENVLRQQVQRMLTDKRGETFMKLFADQWLDLELIDFTEPDSRLYRDFDVIVQESMLAETLAFLNHLLNNNLSVTELIDSEYTFLNSRLARYYEMDQPLSDELIQVSLSEDTIRGGLIGQGAILKVTANGTTTSPVIRGIWVSERLLGQEIPEPPQGVPAIEPDIRGAKSIRDQLEKHKNIESCAACHQHIDPPGYALENFDPAGSWREKYPASRGVKAQVVDPSFVFSDGRQFNNVNEFRSRVLEKPEKLAENFINHLFTYGTGGPINFADRAVVAEIVAKTEKDHYGVRSLLEEVVLSPLFLSK